MILSRPGHSVLALDVAVDVCSGACLQPTHCLVPLLTTTDFCAPQSDTSTVYEKGAEVIGLYRTLLGTEGFKRGMKLYFERHDGQAVTCDDFRAAMAGENGGLRFGCG